MRRIVKMMGISFLMAVLCIGMVFGDVITTIDFETAGGYTTSIVEFTDNGTDYFLRTDGSDISGETFTNIQGTYYFAGQDIDGDGALLPATLNIDDIDISGYSSLTFSIYLAEDDAGDGKQDWDVSDYFHIQYDIDNSGTMSNLLWIENDGSTYNTAPTVDADFNGDGDGSIEVTSTFTQFTKNITGTGNLLDIVLTFNLDGGDEDIAIDNIVISGTAAGGINPATSFSATTASNSQIDLTWTENANGDEVLVVFDTDGTFDAPEDGTPYSGSALGGTVIYQGNAETYSHTSLSANTQYFYKAWSVDADDNYSSGVTTDATTLKAEPSNHVSTFEGTATHNSVTLTWADNDGAVAADGFMVKISTTSLAAIPAPVDGTDENEDEDLSDGAGVITVPSGDEELIVNGLDAESTYYFKIWPFTNSGDGIDFKLDGSIPDETKTTTAAPVIPNLFISEVADPSDDYNNRFVEIFNNSGSTIDFAVQTWYLTKQSNGGSFTNIQLTGTVADGDVYVIGGIASADQDNGSINGNGDDGYFLYYDGNNITGSLVDAYGVIDEDGSDKDWEYEDAHAVRKVAITSGNTVWTADEWTISSATTAQCTPGTHEISEVATPITLVSFTATPKAGSIELTWETASETNNAAFIVYKNGDILTRVAGAGTCSENTVYSVVDDAVKAGGVYTYVLADMSTANVEKKHNDKAVTVEMPTVAAAVADDFVIGAAYPNPFNPTALVPVTLNKDAHVTMTLFDLTGRQVAEIANDDLSAGSYSYRVSGSALSTGLYLLQTRVNGEVSMQKLALMK